MQRITPLTRRTAQEKLRRGRDIIRLPLRILNLRIGGILVADLFVLIVFYILTRGRILALSNVFRLLRQTAEIGILAEAVAVLMISQEFDLSVESYIALIPIVVFMSMQSLGINMFLAVLLGLAFAMILGLINGLIVTKTHLPSFIATLGTMWIYKGIALIISEGWIQRMPESTFGFLLAASVKGFPMPAIWVAAISLSFWFLLRHTAYGNRVYATGGNEAAARSVGIRTDKVKIINFIIVAVAGGITGLMIDSYIGSLSPLVGEGMSLEAIAAAVVGGCSLLGGAGTIGGVLLGTILMAIIRSGLVLLGVSAYWQNLSVGLVVILTVIINRRLTRTQ